MISVKSKYQNTNLTFLFNNNNNNNNNDNNIRMINKYKESVIKWFRLYMCGD